jgi:hypothetical protein
MRSESESRMVKMASGDWLEDDTSLRISSMSFFSLGMSSRIIFQTKSKSTLK